MRDKLKEGIVKVYETFWGGGDVDAKALTVTTPLANAQGMTDYLATLQPKTDAQKQAWRRRASTAAWSSNRDCWSWVLIAILVSWTVALFLGIGLFAEANSRVLSALAFGALSIAFSTFLVLELGLPYTGLMRVSPAALEQAIEFVDK